MVFAESAGIGGFPRYSGVFGGFSPPRPGRAADNFHRLIRDSPDGFPRLLTVAAQRASERESGPMSRDRPRCICRTPRPNPQRLLWVTSRRKAAPISMSAFGGKADVNQGVAECPLIAISGDFKGTRPILGGVCLDDEKPGRMGFRTRLNYQNWTVG